ncbi:hypothetical protein AruPA_10600 [Acidiphilium sp. PA]|uniref:hypothetical protein n=1 Tax=Acidiphilium sp. PA TaxID=2871705 RepID=UPI002244E593|nr:hypothetical protein [Acidiphilium sp. PA]MCW8307487.1 hypothetical protein [Acidiphilium sp. PA]
MTRVRSDLVVLEGKWWPKKNITVKPVFDVLVDLIFGNQHDYYYEMFSTYNALSSILNNNVNSGRGGRYLYIASHGNGESLQGSAEEIKISDFKKITRSLASSYRGIYFGSCLFGNERNAKMILESNHNIRWVAGFGETVDWIQSTALDFVFWNILLSLVYNDEELKRNDERATTSLDKINKTCSKMNEYTPGLVRELKFQVYIRNGNEIRSGFME